MKNERSANEAIVDYNQKEWEQRQAWERVLGGQATKAKVLAAPVKRVGRKPVKVGFFSRFFKVV